MPEVQVTIPIPGSISVEVLQVATFSDGSEIYRLNFNGVVLDLGITDGQVDMFNQATDDMP